MTKQYAAFYKACDAVVNEILRREQLGLDLGSLNYAWGYATAGRKLTTDAEIVDQARYLRGNLSSWRGPKAREVKLVLDKFSKRKGVR